MQNFKIQFRDIPAEGKSVLIEDPDLWQKPMQEFKIDCQVLDPLIIDFFILPIQNGCLVKGTIKGKVSLPCDCCTEDVIISINNTFETFEASPEHDSFLDDDIDEDKDLVIHDETRMLIENYLPVLDLGAIGWEEFLISLPLKPLCQSDCKGLCVQCGVNLNQKECTCPKDKGDPRFAILRDYKIKNKK